MNPHLEKTHLKLGYLPFTDCLPLVVAQRLGLAAHYGLELTLSRQPTWSLLRDRLLVGELDAVQSYYGLPLSLHLGLGGPACPMAVLMTLSQNGESVSVSSQLAGNVRDGDSLYRAVLAATRRLVFAHHLPPSAMWFYYWLASHRIHPLRDVTMLVTPATELATALTRGELDGYGASEPWGALTELDGSGHTIVSSAQVWPDHPGKVLTTTAAFADRYPNTARMLVAVLLEACRWLDHPMHRVEATPWVAEAIGVPIAAIAPRLVEGHGWGGQSHAVRFFGAKGEVGMPWLSDLIWFLTQLRRWGILETAPDYRAVAREINRVDVFRDAAAMAGASAPTHDMRRSVLNDGRVWDGSDPEGYATSFALHSLATESGRREIWH
ncbi:CmpA/NrtA family ABC transporter substrate-binding protein [Chitiniphilus eburneus]|uniref:ABC transporter substrate-binding protein n=1 Tax=Chitiniphilus eburneus TaxID=2571148 RepID=A0A4U0Q5Y6_9NEIS|nr:CmpA/NrtA family ABC transporter substrate-binding protein [Chitiniphilus eburneus]TJZ76190.1 ABC transporter substrate-binding protein [Chitiniphilus eburneus]